MDITTEYSKLRTTVAHTRDYVASRTLAGTREESLYLGTYILYSNLIYSPLFLFIGINPGAGFYNDKGIKYRDTELDPDGGFEYLIAEEEGYDYRLAKQTRSVFASTKFKDCLGQCVKTNLFYTSTSAASQVHEYNSLVMERCGVNYWAQSAEWTKILIELICPKIILCEGKQVLDTLSQYYDLEPKWENEIGSVTIGGDITAIGYKRARSNIRNKPALIRVLNTLDVS